MLAAKRKAATPVVEEWTPKVPRTLESLIAGAALRAEEFRLQVRHSPLEGVVKEVRWSKEEASPAAEAGTAVNAKSQLQSVKSFAAEVRRVLQESDVVFEVSQASLLCLCSVREPCTWARSWTRGIRWAAAARPSSSKSSVLAKSHRLLLSVSC